MPLKKRRAPRWIDTLPDVVLPEDGNENAELGEPGQVVKEVEARIASEPKKLFGSGSRARAHKLHREADQLYYKGDYESALVLYHRAAKLCPQEPSHGVAARRAQGAISSVTRPPRELSRLLRKVRASSQPSLLCPEAAGHRARAIVARSSDPLQHVPKILRYFDSRKDFWRLSSASSVAVHSSRSKTMLRQLDRCVKSTHKELESAYEAGDCAAVHTLSNELVNLVSLTEQPTRNQMETYRYLAMTQVAVRRHDRAVDLATKMIFLARTCNDVELMVQALVTLGKVHLSFGHVQVLVKAWQQLLPDIQAEAIPAAWLYHDIGRCRLEMGEFDLALEASRHCLERASAANSSKWLVRGHVLAAHSLLRLYRYEEALEALERGLECCERLEPDQPTSIPAYVDELAQRVRRLLEYFEPPPSPNQSTGDPNDEQQLTLAPGESMAGAAEEPESLLNEAEGSRASSGRSTDNDKITQLLERTRALRRSFPSSIATSGTSLVPDTARTHVIHTSSHTSDDDDDATIYPDNFHLTDLSCFDDDSQNHTPSDRCSTARSEDNSAAAADVSTGADTAKKIRVDSHGGGAAAVGCFSLQDVLTSPGGGSFKMETSSESTSSGARRKSLSQYLRGLETRDFEELRRQEDFFPETRSGVTE